MMERSEQRAEVINISLASTAILLRDVWASYIRYPSSPHTSLGSKGIVGIASKPSGYTSSRSSSLSWLKFGSRDEWFMDVVSSVPKVVPSSSVSRSSSNASRELVGGGVFPGLGLYDAACVWVEGGCIAEDILNSKAT